MPAYTRNPDRASRSADARPMPLDAPVMTTVLDSLGFIPSSYRAIDHRQPAAPRFTQANPTTACVERQRTARSAPCAAVRETPVSPVVVALAA
jgi:hypothetical protein